MSEAFTKKMPSVGLTPTFDKSLSKLTNQEQALASPYPHPPRGVGQSTVILHTSSSRP